MGKIGSYDSPKLATGVYRLYHRITIIDFNCILELLRYLGKRKVLIIPVCSNMPRTKIRVSALKICKLHVRRPILDLYWNEGRPTGRPC